MCVLWKITAEAEAIFFLLLLLIQIPYWTLKAISGTAKYYPLSLSVLLIRAAQSDSKRIRSKWLLFLKANVLQNVAVNSSTYKWCFFFFFWRNIPVKVYLDLTTCLWSCWWGIIILAACMEQINNLLLQDPGFAFAAACINQKDLCSDE